MVPMARGFLWFLLLIGTWAWAGADAVPRAQDLRADAATAEGRQVPLMIMFYVDDCAYCARMEREFLQPMLLNHSYDDKVMIRRVALDSGFTLADFDGRTISGADLAARYHVSFTPTLLFLDARGKTLADKMVGLTTPDYFGSYLDSAIDESLARLRGPAGDRAVGNADATCHPLC